jgi:hypothetical protein
MCDPDPDWDAEGEVGADLHGGEGREDRQERE